MIGPIATNQDKIGGDTVLQFLPTRVIDNAVLLILFPMIAGCGLIYEYALSHYAGLILGDVETGIFIMIGVMLMSAGLGSLLSYKIKCPYTGMAWIEMGMILVGSTAVLLIAVTVYISQSVNQLFLGHNLAQYTSPENIAMPAVIVSYSIGFLMGFLIGLEMPLVVRIREDLYKNLDSAKNTATVYAADCVGIAAGTFVWAAVLGHLDVTTASSAAAFANTAAAALFMLRYYKKINGKLMLAAAFATCFALILVVFNNGMKWEPKLAGAIYEMANTEHVTAPKPGDVTTANVAFVADATPATVKP